MSEKTKKPHTRSTRDVPFEERIEVLEAREKLLNEIWRLSGEVCWRRREIQRQESSDRAIKTKPLRAMLNELTSYKPVHIWRMLNRKKPITKPWSKTTIDELLSQADYDLHALRLQCREQMALIDELHELKELTRDRRLFDSTRYPPVEGSIADEKRANASGFTAMQWQRLRTPGQSIAAH